MSNISFQYIWIESHTEEESEVNKYHRHLNDVVDDMSTQAMVEVIKKEREQVIHKYFPGIIACLQINGEMVHNDIKKIIHNTTTKDSMKNT